MKTIDLSRSKLSVMRGWVDGEARASASKDRRTSHVTRLTATGSAFGVSGWEFRT